MKKKYPNTQMIQGKLDYLTTLQARTHEVLTPKIWSQRVTMKDKIEFLQSLSNAKTEYWAVVYQTYPELKGKTLIGGAHEILVQK